MKNLINISFIFCLWFLAFLSFGQTDCKVLKAEISLIYKGDCKNGFADGDGEASGRDHFVGKFKKGLPHGKGTYDWSTGEVYEGDWRKGLRHGTGEYSFINNGKDTTISGRWVRDEFVGSNEREANYKIVYKYNIGRLNFINYGAGTGAGNDIKFKVLRGIAEVGVSPSLIGDSGTMWTEGNFIGFRNVEFPFTGKIIFSAPNAFNAATLTSELRFVIYKPGKWDIYIYL